MIPREKSHEASDRLDLLAATIRRAARSNDRLAELSRAKTAPKSRPQRPR
jgi:hypothetical protein